MFRKMSEDETSTTSFSKVVVFLFLLSGAGQDTVLHALS